MTPSPLRLEPRRDYKVFLNCHQGHEFKDMRQGLMLVILATGHYPVWSYNLLDPFMPEFPSAYQGITQSRYSIHECSCCTSQAPRQFGRSNMPVELGMSLLERERTRQNEDFHEIFIIVRKNHPYELHLQALSNTFPYAYDSEQEAMDKVFSWLVETKTSTVRPKFADVLAVWKSFPKKKGAQKPPKQAAPDSNAQELRESLISLCREQSWWREPPWMKFDVFLAHNGKDKQQVEKIALLLRKHGLNPWLDKNEIPAGRAFLTYMEKGIEQSRSAAIVFGANGVGDWQNIEIQALLIKCLDQDIPLIPVLLPGIADDKKLPLFMRTFNWIKFDNLEDGEAMQALVQGIKEDRP
jgi:hypothetical protein